MSFFKKLFDKENIKQTLAVSIAIFCVVAFVFAYLIVKPLPQKSVVLLESKTSVAFVVDEKRRVQTIYSLSDQSDIVAQNVDLDKHLIKVPADDSVKVYVDNACKAGLFDYENVAIKIGVFGDGVDLKKVVERVEKFFADKGVPYFVQGNNITEEYLASACDLDSSINVIDQLLSNPSAHYKRIALNKDLDGLSAIYKENVLNGSFIEYLRFLINGAQKRNQILKVIAQKNDIISKDIEGGYWGINPDVLPGKVSQNFVIIRDKLTEYKKIAYETIDSLYDFYVACETYCIEDDKYQTLQALISDLSCENFNKIINKLYAVPFLSAGVKETICDLTKIPTTTEDYVLKGEMVLNLWRQMRNSTFNYAYQQYREPLDILLNKEYKQTILDEYGTFETYWLAINQPN